MSRAPRSSSYASAPSRNPQAACCTMALREHVAAADDAADVAGEETPVVAGVETTVPGFQSCRRWSDPDAHTRALHAVDVAAASAKTCMRLRNPVAHALELSAAEH